MDRILRVTGPRQTTNPPFLLPSFSPVGETERGTVDGGRILPIPSARSGPPSPPTCPERGCSLPGRQSGAVHLGRCLPDVDTGVVVGGGGVSFVVVARSKRDGGEEQQQIRTDGWLDGCGRIVGRRRTRRPMTMHRHLK